MRICGNWKALIIEVLIIIGSCLCKLLRRRTGNQYPDEGDC